MCENHLFLLGCRLAIRRLPLIVAVVFFVGSLQAANVVSFGANGNDLADDTVAFQNCINSNTLIDVPAGTYYISSKLSLPANRTLQGVLNNPEAVVLKLVGATDGIDVGPAANTTVQDLTLDRIESNTSSRALNYALSTNFTVRRVNILNHRSTAPAFIANNATNGLIEDCLVSNYGWFDTNSNQVRGVGIRLSDCVDSIVRNNRVLENQNLIPANPVSNFYQAGGIEISGNARSIVEYNTIVTAGNGIDAGQASNSIVRFNTVRNAHEVGIKLVNGARDNTVFGNVIDKAGIANIWLTPGSPGPTQDAVRSNLVDGNVLRGAGLGIGVDYWPVAGLRPSGIILEGSNNSPSVVARNNVVTRNLIQTTSKLVAPVTEYEGFVYDPYDNMIAQNSLRPKELDSYGFFRPGFGAGLWRAVRNAGGSPPDIDGTSGDFVLSGQFGNGSVHDVALVGDVNGDGADDRVVYNTSSNSWIWDSAPRSGFAVRGGFGDGAAEQIPTAFGQPGDVPLLGDINGDGAADRVLFRPSDSSWHVDLSAIPVWPYHAALHGFGDGEEDQLGGNAVFNAGLTQVDHAALADYDGNGIADRTVFCGGGFYRTLNPGGNSWSTGADSTSVGVGLGNSDFIPPPWIGDLDGDGFSDNIAWNGIGNGTVFARLSSTNPPWGEIPTISGLHYGDPNQDTSFFVGNFDLPEFLLAPLARGDYNIDGTVDAADYVVWRDSFGKNGFGLTADGNGNGIVDAPDYEIWRQNFGANSPSATASRSRAAVPEPVALLVAISAMLLILEYRGELF